MKKKDLLKDRKNLAENSTAWLIEHEYVYSPVFGWEKANIVERFNLNPNLTGIPTELKPLLVEVTGKNKDTYGNVVGGDSKTSYTEHPTAKKRVPTQNWFDYRAYKLS